MIQSLDQLCEILEAPKRLVSLGSWRTHDRQYRITAALESDGLTIAGISFMACASRERPDERISITLQAEIRRKPMAFARIDWRGSPHDNNHKWCGDRQFLGAGRTHFHDTALHSHIDFSELFSGDYNLPIAESIMPEPSSFDKLLVITRDLLHIENITEVPVPPWSPRASFI